MLRYKLNLASQEDFIFLKKLHKLTMKTYVESIWGWDDAQQDRMFKDNFDPSKSKIIEFEKQNIGVLSIEERGSEIFLSNILIMPEFQNLGLGGEILKSLMERAKLENISLTLTVLRPNRAKLYYERLGFKVIKEDEIRFYMKWRK